MEEYRRRRRGFIKTVAAGVIGAAVGGVAGFLAAPREAPGPAEITTVTRTEVRRETVTQTVTAGVKPRGIPSEPLKIGLLNPISGGAAPLGDPGVKGAQLAVEVINERGGILGRKVELLDPLDTQVKPDIAVDHFTRLVEAEGVEYIVGGISSSVGLALGDAADKLGAIWFPTEVWTPELMAAKKRKFAFRLSWIDSAAGVGAALMALRLKPDLQTIAGINPDYAHGRVQWEAFSLAMKRLKPDVEIVAELFHPLLRTRDFAPFITKLREAKPDVVQSTSWGSDKLTFYKQAIPTGYFKETIHLDVCQLGLQIHTRENWPEGVWGGSQYTRFYPPWSRWPANREFNERFVQRFGVEAFGMSEQSAANSYTDIFAIKAGIEKAASLVGGWPDIDEVAEALVGMQIISPKGILTIREDHDFDAPQVWAIPRFVPGEENPVVEVKDVVTFPPELTNPAPGVPWRDWIKSM